MSTINEKLLLECIDAILSGDMKTAQRKFNNNWDRTALKVTEALDMEDSEEDAEIDSTVDDVIEDEAASEEDCFDDILAAVSELETKFPTEMTDEIQGHFDELKNKVDDLRLGSEEDDDEEACDAALMALDDLKSDFDLAGGLEDDVIDIFNEIGSKLSGCAECEAEEDEFEDGEEVEEEEKDIVAEAKDGSLSEEGEPKFDVEEGEKELTEPANPESDETEEEDEDEDEEEEEGEVKDDRTAEETILDAQAHTKELEAEMDALMAKAKDGELEESFKTLKSDSLKREKAGVAKAGLAMPRPTKIDTDAKMGTSAGDSKGKAVPKTVSKRIESPSEQVLKWKPIPKHNPKAASAKSVIG